MPPNFPWPTTLAAAGIAIAAVLLAAFAFLADRPRGRTRCPKCWYDMVGAPDLTCPECGRTARSRRELLRTRRHWRIAAICLPLLGIAATTAAVPFARSSNPWSLAPDFVLIRMLPSIETGVEPYAREFDSRQYLSIERRSSFVYWDSEVCRVGDLAPRTRRLLAQQSVTALARRLDHPWRVKLLRFLGALEVHHDSADTVLLPLIESSDEETRWAALLAIAGTTPSPERTIPPLMSRAERLLDRVGIESLAYREPSEHAIIESELERDGLIHEINLIVEAFGEYGPDARDAVPLILRLGEVRGSIKGPQVYSWVRTVGRIGPDAADALPRVTVTDPDLSGRAWDCLSCVVAELLIRGEFTNEDDAILHLANHRSWRTRRGVVQALSSTGDEAEAHQLVLAQMLSDPSTYVADEAADALLKHGLQIDLSYAALIEPDPPGERNSVWTRAQLLDRYGLDATPLIPEVAAELDRLIESDAYPTTIENFTRLLAKLEARAASGRP